jgi:hypothetical protein
MTTDRPCTLTLLSVPSSGFGYWEGEGRLTGVNVDLLRDFARFEAMEPIGEAFAGLTGRAEER